MQTSVFLTLENFSVMRKTDIKTNNHGVLGNMGRYRHAENVLGQGKEKPHWSGKLGRDSQRSLWA